MPYISFLKVLILSHPLSNQWCNSAKRTEPAILNKRIDVYHQLMLHDFNPICVTRKYFDHSWVPSTSMWKSKNPLLWSFQCFLFSLKIPFYIGKTGWFTEEKKLTTDYWLNVKLLPAMLYLYLPPHFRIKAMHCLSKCGRIDGIYKGSRK